MSQINLAASFDNISHRKDGSCKVSFETGELNGEQIMMLLGFRNSTGWLLFKENNEFKIPEMEAPSDLKTPSQRAHNALYVLYKSKPRECTFQVFYNEYYERVIQNILNQVPK